VLFISNLTPLLPEGTKDDIVTSMMTQDEDGNFFGLAVSYFLPFGNTVTENKLYITKISQDQEVEWNQIFTVTGELAPLDFIADLNGDLINVGAFQSSTTPGIIEGYFLKIFGDGSFVSAIELNTGDIEIVNVFPNPVGDVLCIKTEMLKEVYVDVFSVDGRQAMRRIKAWTNEALNLTELHQGWYSLRITDESSGAFKVFSIFKN